MGKLFENLKRYFENTPSEDIEKDWKEVEMLNDIGPDVIEYADIMKGLMDTNIFYSDNFDYQIKHINEAGENSGESISACAEYYLAA